MEKALAEVDKLPPGQQDALASIILDEMADGQRWDDAFTRSQDKLAKLAEKARADKKAGRGKHMGIDEL